MLKAKSDGGFADEEKSRAKGNGLSASAECWKQNAITGLQMRNKQEKKNGLSASAERKKQNAMTGLQMQNKQEQKEMHYLQVQNAESKRRW